MQGSDVRLDGATCGWSVARMRSCLPWTVGLRGVVGSLEEFASGTVQGT